MMPSSPLGDFNQLTVPQRLDLIEKLWDSIDTLEALPVPEWHREELDRRLAEADAAPDANIPWEQVRSELRGRS
jgi:putative addiction module component (TIGR02574 family)